MISRMVMRDSQFRARGPFTELEAGEGRECDRATTGTSRARTASAPSVEHRSRPSGDRRACPSSPVGDSALIECAAGGRVVARVDCNRGSGMWKATAAGQLEFGPLALTRAECPDGSLHDQIDRQWMNVRSFVLKNGHLFLSLMADGGPYESAPVVARQP